MKVVVGKAMNRTPIFVDQMEYVVFRPYWNPPYGITTKEIVPHARRDPSYLGRENFEIVASGARRRARPARHAGEPRRGGGRPPLHPAEAGAAQLARPRQVHLPERRQRLHARHARARRCSRGRAATSATAASAWRTRPPWPSGCCATARAGRARASTPPCKGERPTQVNLRQPLTVVLFYDTVHVNSEGIVHFVGDIYGHDRALDQALARGYPYPTAG